MTCLICAVTHLCFNMLHWWYVSRQVCLSMHYLVFYIHNDCFRRWKNSDMKLYFALRYLISAVNKNNTNTKLCRTFSVFLKPFLMNLDWGMLVVTNKIRKHVHNQMWRSSLRPVQLFVRGLYSLTALILLWVCFPTPCLRLLVQWKEQFLLTLHFLTILFGLRIVWG